MRKWNGRGIRGRLREREARKDRVRERKRKTARKGKGRLGNERANKCLSYIRGNANKRLGF
jgi:hypothetical protein